MKSDNRTTLEMKCRAWHENGVLLIDPLRIRGLAIGSDRPWFENWRQLCKHARHHLRPVVVDPVRASWR